MPALSSSDLAKWHAAGAPVPQGTGYETLNSAAPQVHMGTVKLKRVEGSPKNSAKNTEGLHSMNCYFSKCMSRYRGGLVCPTSFVGMAIQISAHVTRDRRH